MNVRCLDWGHVPLDATNSLTVCIRCGHHTTPKGTTMHTSQPTRKGTRRTLALLALFAILGALWPWPAHATVQGRYRDSEAAKRPVPVCVQYAYPTRAERVRIRREGGPAPLPVCVLQVIVWR